MLSMWPKCGYLTLFCGASMPPDVMNLDGKRYDYPEAMCDHKTGEGHLWEGVSTMWAIGSQIKANARTWKNRKMITGLCSPRKGHGILARLLANQREVAAATKLIHF